MPGRRARDGPAERGARVPPALVRAPWSLAGGLLFLFLRRRGHADGRPSSASLLFGLTPPMARVVETPFFLEPVGILLVISLLLAIESGAGWGTLALLATLATLAKDGVIVLSLVPALVLVAAGGAGRAVALWRPALAAALPAALLTPALRWWWTPHIPVVAAPWDLELVRAAVSHAAPRVGARPRWPHWSGGLIPLAACWGASTAAGRAHLRRYGISLGTPSRDGLPGLAQGPEPRAGAALRGELRSAPDLFRAPDAPARPGRARPAGPGVSAAPSAALASSRRGAPSVGTRRWPPWSRSSPTFALVDRYRRIDLQGSRDGPLVLAVCRETWRTAARLAAGDEVVLDPADAALRLGRIRPRAARAHALVPARRLGGARPLRHQRSRHARGGGGSPAPRAGAGGLELRLRMMSPIPETLALSRERPAAGVVARRRHRARAGVPGARAPPVPRRQRRDGRLPGTARRRAPPRDPVCGNIGAEMTRRWRSSMAAILSALAVAAADPPIPSASVLISRYGSCAPATGSTCRRGPTASPRTA